MLDIVLAGACLEMAEPIRTDLDIKPGSEREQQLDSLHIFRVVDRRD